MKTSAMDPVKGITLVALGLAIAVMGIYVAGADDAPGAAVIGMLLMVVGVVLGLRVARKRLPIWAARTALAVDVVVAAFAAFLAHDVVMRTPLFAQSPEVPSVVGSAPSLQHTAAVERARELVRAAVLVRAIGDSGVGPASPDLMNALNGACIVRSFTRLSSSVGVESRPETAPLDDARDD